jgi:hypothetical protein
VIPLATRLQSCFIWCPLINPTTLSVSPSTRRLDQTAFVDAPCLQDHLRFIYGFLCKWQESEGRFSWSALPRSAQSIKMASTVTACQDASPYQPRNYQLEMLEASMKENIIVAVCSLIPYFKLQNGNDNDPLDGYRERQNAYVCLSVRSLPGCHCSFPSVRYRPLF